MLARLFLIEAAKREAEWPKLVVPEFHPAATSADNSTDQSTGLSVLVSYLGARGIVRFCVQAEGKTPQWVDYIIQGNEDDAAWLAQIDKAIGVLIINLQFQAEQAHA